MATLETAAVDNVESGRRSSVNNSGKVERECRICHLSLYSCSSDSLSSGAAVAVAIELGCSCKDDMAAAHKHCADTWFNIKGNKTCEICNSIAENVHITGLINVDMEAAGDMSDGASVGPSDSGVSRRCLNGHRVLNLVLACLVFALAISWLFHVNIPS